MPNYKDTNGKLHVIDDAAYEHLLPAGSVQITAQEAADLLVPTPEQIAAQAAQEALLAAKAEAKADNIVQYLRDHTPAECAQYVQDNVTDLASAKAFLKKVAIVLCALSKESLR